MTAHPRRTLALVSVVLLFAACARAPGAPLPRSTALAPPSTTTAASVSPAAPAPPPAPASWVVPPEGLSAPMAGDPDAGALATARLRPATCAQNQGEIDAAVQRKIARMREEIAQGFASWKEQPSCEEVRLQSMGIGDSFGYGGLGLSGVGEGGGGRGEGIGLGAIGTLGHGSGSVARARSASGTNNQVDGVDEADIVKTDGAYVYLVAGGALRIVEALHPRLVSVTRLPGDVKELLLDGDRAVAFVGLGGNGSAPCRYAYDCTFGGDGSRTEVLVLDVADRGHPRVTRRIDLSGSLLAARRIGGAVHTVFADGDTREADYETWPREIPYDCKVKGMDARAVKARFDALAQANEKRLRSTAPGFPSVTEGGVTRPLCDALHPALRDGTAYTSVVSFDLHDDKASVTAVTLQSRPGAVFASEHGLYLAVRHERAGGAEDWYPFAEDRDEVSDVHAFRIGARASETGYAGSGVVPGHVLNQFAMDEWYGYLRVATTTGRVPDPRVSSSISVLGMAASGSLVRVGAVDGLAPGEDIRAVRFDGDRGYVVTFKKTDPLFVVDLGAPTAPRVLGELQIPGFSTYLHRIDPTHLLAIGFDAVDHGSFAYFDGVLLQLFDVSHPTEPVLLHREKIGSRGSSSEAATDHLAFNYLPDRHLLAVPMTVCEGGGDGRFGETLAFSGLLVYDVTLEGGFRRLGGIDHGKSGASCSTWWSDARSHVKRSLFLDDLVFSIATDRIKVQRMPAFGQDVGNIALSP